MGDQLRSLSRRTRSPPYLTACRLWGDSTSWPFSETTQTEGAPFLQEAPHLDLTSLCCSQALYAAAAADGVDARGHYLRRAPPQPHGGQRRHPAGGPTAAARPGLRASAAQVGARVQPLANLLFSLLLWWLGAGRELGLYGCSLQMPRLSVAQTRIILLCPNPSYGLLCLHGPCLSRALDANFPH